MSINKIIIVFWLLLIFSCSSSDAKVVKEKNNIPQQKVLNPSANNIQEINSTPFSETVVGESNDESFVEFFSKIPKLEVGYKTVCYQMELVSDSIESIFKSNGATILGRLNPINDFYFIVYIYPADLPLPILEVYDKQGEKMNDVQLFNYGFCTDMLADNQYSSFEILTNEKIEILSFIESIDSIEIVQRDTIDLFLEISGLGNIEKDK